LDEIQIPTNTMSRKILFPLLLCLLLGGVYLLERTVFQSYSGAIDEALLPHAEQFVAEAARRGMDVDLDELTLVFNNVMIEVDSQSFCGYTHTLGTEAPPYVEISRPCWDAYSDQQREILVFHELGHALLQQRHRNERLPSGSLASLMNSLNTFSVYDKFTLPKREYYLDELFLEEATLPDWASAKTERHPWFLDPYPLDTTWQFKGPGSLVSGEKYGDEAGARAYALKIEVPERSPLEQPVFWRHITSHPKIPEGTKLVLRAKIHLDGVTGPGVALAVRGEHFLSGESPLNFSTKKETTLNGNGYQSIELVVTDYFPDGINALYVFLIMQPGSTGTAYFDDVVLEQYR